MEPKIRFKGFEGEWKDTIWGNHIVSTHTGTNLLGEVSNKGIPLLKMGNIQRGFFDLDKMEYLAANQNPPVNCIANYGDFFYNTRNTLELVGKGATWMKKDGIYAFNSNIAICKLNGIDTFFFNYLYNTLRSIKQVQARAKGTTSVAAVYMRDLKSIELTLPHISEQQAIASYFTSLDSQISACISRLASLKQMKAASLQAMFPQEGETVPKIRFKGFEGEWKKVKFSETFESLKNNSLSRAELSNDGDIVNVHYGDVLIKYGDLLNIQNEELTFIADNKIGNTLYNSCHLQNGDIIIADAAEDNTVGKCSEIVNICNKRVVSGLHTIPCRPLNCFAQGYLGHYINSESYHHQLLPLIQGSKISSISKKALSQTIVLVPSIEEQKLIAKYFTSLDRQISLQSQRLEKLKQIKSACLDKMFV